MRADFGRVVIDEMPDPVMGDASEFRPLPKRAYRRFFARREDSAQAKSDDISELTANTRERLCFHAHARVSTPRIACV